MDLLKLLWDFRFVTLFLFFVIFKIAFDRQGFQASLYNLMLQAKRQAKDNILKSGHAQEEWVVRKALNMLPLSWKIFIGENTIRRWVRVLYRKGMDVIDDGKLNDSYSKDVM